APKPMPPSSIPKPPVLHTAPRPALMFISSRLLFVSFCSIVCLPPSMGLKLPQAKPPHGTRRCSPTVRLTVRLCTGRWPASRGLSRLLELCLDNLQLRCQMRHTLIDQRVSL